MIRESKFFKLRDGVELHIKVKEVDSPVWLIVTHGIGEHLERHQFLNSIFVRDLNILFYDLRGHGKSSGRRAYIDNFSDYYDDLDEIIQCLKKDYKMKRYTLFGHSMGGLITSGYLQKIKNKEKDYPERVFLSSPAVSVPGILGGIVDFSPVFILDKLTQFKSIAIKGSVNLSNLSHNSLIEDDFNSDPLNCHKIETKLLVEMGRAMREVFSTAIRLKCPTMVVYGTGDIIVDQKAIERYFTEIEKSALIEKFEGAFHEIHNESEEFRRDYFEILKTFFLDGLYQ